MHSRFEIGISGFDCVKAIAFKKVATLLIEVYDPGPWPKTKRSKFDRSLESMLIFCRRDCQSGRLFLLWFTDIDKRSSPILDATEVWSPVESIAKTSIIKFLFLCLQKPH